MKNKRALLLFIIAAWIFPAKAGAESSISPALALREEYNDNIGLTRDNRIDDFITSVHPSLAISLKSRAIDLSADYGFNLRFYAHNSEHNQMRQRANLATKLTLLPERLFIKVSDDYERVPIDQRNQVALDNLFVNLTDVNHLTVNPYLEYPITSTLKFTAGYTYQNVWYDNPIGDDSDDHSATAGLNKQFGERLSVNCSYAYRWHRPRQTNEYDSQTESIGAAVQVTPKFSLNGSVGYTEINYKDDIKTFFVLRVISPNTIAVSSVQINAAPSDTSSLIWNAQANYRLTELFSVGVGYSRSFADSVYEGSVKSDNLNGSVSYSGVVPITVSGFMSKSNYIITGREDRSFGAIVTASVPMSSRLTCGLDGTYTHYNFQPDNEKVDRYGFRIGIDYRIAIATLGIGYTWNLSDSSFPVRDYYNNILFAQAKFTF